MLRGIAQELAVPIVNGQGNPQNTRQLGNLVIRTIDQLGSRPSVAPNAMVEVAGDDPHAS